MPDVNTPIALNGWAQPHDGLRALLPTDAWHVPYSDDATIEALWHKLAGQNPGLVVGWSLGGQLAARAVMDGVLRPRKLVLIAAPWCYVATPDYPHGMGPSTYELFLDNYATQPDRTARRFAGLIAHGDSEAARIQAEQASHLSTMTDNARWLPWLKELGQWQPDAQAAKLLPPTLIIHGHNDGVVPFAQSDEWMRHLPHARLLALPDVGHAPHLHNEARIQRAIADFTREAAHG